MKRFNAILIGTFLCLVINASATVKLPAIIGDNMVLQQRCEAALWGTAKLNSKVVVTTSWNNRKCKVKTNSNGQWSLKVLTPSAGGPYTITLDDGQKLKLTNILIGEVWVCSGQSNMNMSMRGFQNQPILNSNEILLDADNKSIRLFEVGRTAALTPQVDCKGQWTASNALTAGNFSALAFQFGKMLHEKLKVPIGLIHASIGGTKIQTWMSIEDLEPLSQDKVPESFEKIKNHASVSTANYNGMIAPIVGYGIKGFIWYQGEANYKEPKLYEKLFPAMVSGWRKRWGCGLLPFYYVQIAPFARPEKELNARFMEVQLNCLKLIPNSGMVSIVDAGIEKGIHPPNKTIPAQRLAYWAMANTYNINGITYSGPIIDSVKVLDGRAIIKFSYAEKGLTSYGKTLTEFEIAGNDRIFYPAIASILPNGSVEVQSEKVKKIASVRYAFKNWVVGDLFNTAGLPVIPFRTDNWE